MEFLQITEFPASNPKLSAPFSPSKRHEQETIRGASHSAKRIDHAQSLHDPFPSNAMTTQFHSSYFPHRDRCHCHSSPGSNQKPTLSRLTITTTPQ